VAKRGKKDAFLARCTIKIHAPRFTEGLFRQFLKGVLRSCRKVASAILNILPPRAGP
jgi:hypothetical protein